MYYQFKDQQKMDYYAELIRSLIPEAGVMSAHFIEHFTCPLNISTIHIETSLNTFF